MKFIELKHKRYLERIIRGLFPNVWIILLYILLGFGFLYLFTLEPFDHFFWFLLTIYFPLSVYIIIIRPLIESKIYITTIAFDEKREEIRIEYLKFQDKRQINIGIKEMKYNIFNSHMMSLADRIIFYDGKKKLLTQYSNSNWSITQISDVAKSLDKIGVKKLFGHNK